MAENKVDLWYEENVIEDHDIIESIGQYAVQHVYNCFRIRFKDYKRPIAVYAIVFEAIREVLKEMENTHESFAINIANRLEVGFTSSFDEDSSDLEKVGNFMIYIKQMPNMATTDNKDDEESRSVVLCTEWNAANINENVKTLEKISVLAKKKLDENLDMVFDSVEVPLPLFCTIHESIINYMKGLKARESKFEIVANMANVYDIYIMSMEDGDEVTIKPKVYDKITFKDDKGASSQNE